MVLAGKMFINYWPQKLTEINLQPTGILKKHYFCKEECRCFTIIINISIINDLIAYNIHAQFWFIFDCINLKFNEEPLLVSNSKKYYFFQSIARKKYKMMKHLFSLLIEKRCFFHILK